MEKSILTDIKESKIYLWFVDCSSSIGGKISNFIVNNIELIHGISMIIGMLFLIVTFFQLKQQIGQTQIQINQVQKQLDNSSKEFDINKKYEKMKFIHEIYLPFENEPIASMLYAYRSRNNEFLKQFTNDDNVQLLNHVEYVLRVDEKVKIDEEDFALNFNWIFEIVCSRPYFVGEKGLIAQRGGYSGILRKCKEL